MHAGPGLRLAAAWGSLHLVERCQILAARKFRAFRRRVGRFQEALSAQSIPLFTGCSTIQYCNYPSVGLSTASSLRRSSLRRSFKLETFVRLCRGHSNCRVGLLHIHHWCTVASKVPSGRIRSTPLPASANRRGQESSTNLPRLLEITAPGTRVLLGSGCLNDRKSQEEGGFPGRQGFGSFNMRSY
jgi:hypothetical protein